MPSPALPVPIVAATDKVLDVGDSIIRNGLFYPIQRQIHSAQRVAQFGSQPLRATNRARAGSQQMPFITDGISGTGIANLAANVATRIIAYAPTVIFWLVSVNDLGMSVAQPGTGTWTTNAITVRNAITAGLPNAKVCLVGVLMNGEQWTVSPGWGTNAADGQIANLNSEAQAFAAASGYYWINVRGATVSDPNTILNWESVNNTPAPGAANGKLTYPGDGVHPVVFGTDSIIAGFISQGIVTVV